MPRFSLPAMVVVEAADPKEAQRKAGYLERASRRIDGYTLEVTGRPTERKEPPSPDRCERCGGPRHDPYACPVEAGASS